MIARFFFKKKKIIIYRMFPSYEKANKPISMYHWRSTKPDNTILVPMMQCLSRSNHCHWRRFF
jgi:hypothetical protein